MEYLKDWRIWLMCFVVVVIIQVSEWAWASDNTQPERTTTMVEHVVDTYYGFAKFAKKAVDIKFHPTKLTDGRFRWDEITLKQYMSDARNTHFRFDGEVGMDKYKGVLTINFEF